MNTSQREAEIDAWLAIEDAEHRHAVRVLHRHYYDHPKLAAELHKECLIDELVEPIMDDER